MWDRAACHGRSFLRRIEGLLIGARVLTALGRCLVEARPVVQVVFLMRFASGAALGTGRLRLGAALLGALGWSLATCAIYLCNGIADYAEDVGNGSRRPIASGALPLAFARRVVLVLAFAALVQAMIAGPCQFAVMLSYLTVGYAYSGPPFPLKRRYYTASLGGAALGLLTYLGGAVASARAISAPLLVFALAMTAWMGGVGGIAKDLSDVTGDRLAGRRSWPLVLGPQRAGGLMLLVAFAVAAGFTAAAAVAGHGLLLPAAAVAAGAVVLAVVTARVPPDASRRVRRRPYRVFMAVQYLGHAGLVLALLAPL
ncbi:UbiA family prenyltransferase [Actinocrinis puniceicyclus]|uniref:UbiA family prenyltransferase n=1 Tax=Actinocrinis puniceicyclus TaxID=977794 RepID=A0A8J7WPL4_9ACTN|nr:UbiA family prenyltransferase [Actinocrinis puniceicyclus]MBS2963689.1 UbiA family prenyltransferase [Actinocrinis puniceicyclus]